jgi:hypothetical protein
MKFSSCAIAASLSLLAAGAAQAASVTYSGNAVDTTRSGMGDEIGSAFDTFDYHAFTGSANVASPVNVALGSISFGAGANCNACSLTPSFTDAIDLTLDGVTKQFDFTYSWHSSGPADYLSFSPTTSLTWDLGGGEIATVAFDTPAMIANTGGTITENLTATISAVPEPASVTMLLAGLGLGLAGVMRRRSGAATRA